MNFIKRIFGSVPATDYAALLKAGATVVDVRTQGEYRQGHIKGSLNIPLDTLKNNLSRLRKDQVIITCCASGMRSASAKNILNAAGFAEVYNGGGWTGLQNKFRS